MGWCGFISRGAGAGRPPTPHRVTLSPPGMGHTVQGKWQLWPPQTQGPKKCCTGVCCAWRPQGRECPHLQLVLHRDISSRLTIFTDASACSKSIRSLEHVQVQLSLSYSRRGDLVVALSSPMGTTSTLVTVR